MEWWWLVIVIVPVVAAIAVVVRCWRLGRPAPLDLTPEDTAELDALGAALAAEHHREIAAHLGAVLDRLRHRRVPLAKVRGTPGVPGQLVLQFADGTEVVARAAGHDAMDLAVAVTRERVLLAQWRDDGTGFPVLLAWRAEGRVLDAVAVAA